MTSHSLVRCSTERLLGHAAQQHPVTGPDPVVPVARWRAHLPLTDRTTCWRTRLPDGSVLEWCLEVEPGAHGVLAHLSAAPVAGRLTWLPGPVQRLALRRWTEHELTALARAVEAGSTVGPRRRWAAIG
ncbi:hypothetical protein [uncultured Friedmanniella sp.]|uniref:hypothetical protein n=1 Tax=uncultured Friedmanniella sp. TaxID=335381 RepID=UPI0035CB8647